MSWRTISGRGRKMLAGLKKDFNEKVLPTIPPELISKAKTYCEENNTKDGWYILLFEIWRQSVYALNIAGEYEYKEYLKELLL